MTPSRSRVRIDRIDLDLVYYTLHMSMGKRVRVAAAGNVGGDDEFSDGRQSPILHAIESAAGRVSLDKSEGAVNGKNILGSAGAPLALPERLRTKALEISR